MAAESFDPTTIEAVFFDYGGTLDADGVAWKERFMPLYREAGLCVEPARFDEAFYGADDSLLAEQVWTVSLSEIIDEQVARVLARLGAYARSTHEYVSRAFYEASVRQVQRNEPVLRRLQGEYRLGIISNNYGNLASICEQTGLAPYFEVLVDSNEVGHTKPDGRIFRAALDALDVHPARALMVGDSLARDMRGARDAGMAHAWLVPPASAGERACCPGDPVITSLSGVLGVLGL